jgi:hypothetical protein
MMKFLLSFFLVSAAHAYVPTVESLFRHGANPDVTSNGISVTFVVKKIQPGGIVGTSGNDSSLLKDEKVEDFYKIYFTKTGDSLKVAQTRYKDSKFSNTSLEHKIYYPNLTAYTFKPSIEEVEKGIFFGVLRSLLLNDGANLVNYLKALGVPVKLNQEILNAEKVELLANYKSYLSNIQKDRSARKTEENPLRPEDSAARAKAEELMAAPMYMDTKQVKLARDEGQVAWMVKAGAFEATASYRNRDLQRVKYKSPAGDFEIICKDYWVANGSHVLPRYIIVKSLTGETYQLELTNLSHYNDKESDMVKRLNGWDQLLKGKVSSEMRPIFLL